jgi:hypothetical protein
MRQKLFSAIFLFAWGAFFLVFDIIGVNSGRVGQGHWGMRLGLDLTPESAPLKFWGIISMNCVFAIVGFLLGIRELCAYLRSRQNRK